MIKKLQQLFFKNRTPAVSYFTHIPKTAGTSFIVLLDRFYPVDKIFPHQLWRKTDSIDVAKNQKYDLYRGHFGGGGVKVLSNRSIDYFTIVRHPNALAQSTYHYILREQNTKVHHLVKDLAMEFKTFLNHPMTAPLVKNRMVRNLSFDFTEDPAAQEVFLSAETIAYLQSVINKQKTAITDEQRLKRAIKFIKACRWFGLLERFDESLQLLCFEMNWPPIGHSQKLNTQNKKASFSTVESERLAEINQQDLKLYKFAEAVFEDKIIAMNKSLNQFKNSEQQSIDDLIDCKYQHHHARNSATVFNKKLHYGFEQILLGSQWHRRELMQPENEYFRWTGPDRQVTIDFWMQARNYQLSIRLINATSIELLNQLAIEINGHPINWQSNDTGLVRVLKLDCPKEIIKDNGLVRLKFICDHMISHQQAFDSADERLVGIAVHWIKFNHES